MKASEVHQVKFPVDHILYDDGEFSVAWGSYEGEKTKRLGMRWTGDSANPDDVGYPKQGRNSVWFMLAEELTVGVATALVGTSSADQKNVLRVLEELRAIGALER